MKIIFESKPTVKFKEIKVGQVFMKSGENRIYMATSYIYERSNTLNEETCNARNCIDLESGMMWTMQPIDDVVLLNATLLLK